MKYYISLMESNRHQQGRANARKVKAATSRHGFIERATRRKCYKTYSVETISELLEIVSTPKFHLVPIKIQYK